MPKSHKPHNTTLAVIANDFHVPFHDRNALALFRRFLADERPDWLVLGGDFADFWEISSFDKTPRTDARFTDEIKAGRKVLAGLRRLLPRARITWIEGNHEFRLRKYLIKNAPELIGLPGLAVRELFKLRDLDIEYVACAPQATKFVDNFVRVGQLFTGHWDKVSKHGGSAAKALVDEKNVSLIQGHTHRFGAHARTTVDGRVILGIENFCMCNRGASYVARPNWQLGFSVVYLDDRSGRFQWYPVSIAKDGFIWNGRWYRRRQSRKPVARSDLKYS